MHAHTVEMGFAGILDSDSESDFGRQLLVLRELAQQRITQSANPLVELYGVLRILSR